MGWFALLKGVPWVGVISTAPLVAEGARQLWKAVAKKEAIPEPVAARPHPASPDPAALESRVFALESGMDDFHAQMVKSSELIKELADQNAALVKLVEAHRIHMLWLSGSALLMAIVALSAVWLS